MNMDKKTIVKERITGIVLTAGLLYGFLFLIPYKFLLAAAMICMGASVLLYRKYPRMRIVFVGGCVLNIVSAIGLIAPYLLHDNLILLLGSDAAILFFIAAMGIAILYFLKGTCRFGGFFTVGSFLLLYLVGGLNHIVFFHFNAPTFSDMTTLSTFRTAISTLINRELLKMGAAAVLFAGMLLFFLTPFHNTPDDLVKKKWGDGKLLLRISGIWFTVLGTIDICSNAFLLITEGLSKGSYLDSRLLYTLLLYSLFITGAGLYGTLYADRRDKAVSCIVLGSLLLVMALINLVLLLIEMRGGLILIFSLAAVVMPILYLSGAIKNKW